MGWLILEILLAIIAGGLIGWLVAYFRGRAKEVADRHTPNSAAPSLDLPPAAHWLLDPSIRASPAQNLRPDWHRLLQVLDAINEGAFVLDGTQTIIAANNSAERLLGLEAKGLLGSKVWQIVQHRPFLDALEHVQLGATVTADVTYHHPRERILRVHALVVPNPVSWGGTSDAKHHNRGDASLGAANPWEGSGVRDARYLLVILRDVTQVRRLEEYRREFLGNVSHELKTPLAAIQAAAETLHTLLPNDPQSASRFIQIILDNAERLGRLIQDVMQLARIEAGQQSWHKEAVRVAELVQDVVERHQPRAEQKGLRMVIEPSSEPVTAWVDADALTRILENLLDNAIKYTPRGTITVRWWPTDRQVVVEVADTGVGIPPEHLPRIFERFYRVDKGRSRSQGGSGLGLAIVKHLVQAMNGSIEVRSQPEVGTCFTVRLPRPETSPTDAAAKQG